tara:strand:+ start:703 stop:1344 length:642 start_codon:yes stop_codon:yes gene_type:complete
MTDHLQKLKKRLLEKHNFTLPDGWEVRCSRRRQGESKLVDAYYYPPDGARRLRSVKEVEKFLGLSSSPTGTNEGGASDASFIYILKTQSFDHVKIGESIDPVQRIKVLNAAVPYKFEIFATFRSPFPPIKGRRGVTISSGGTKKLEEVFHARYAHLRAPNGEFFSILPETVVSDFDTDIRVLTQLYSHDQDEAYEYLNLMLDVARLKCELEQT